MQLSRLLARLSPEERRELVERRLGENAVGIDDHALASQLAQARSLAPVYLELNSAQLLLLRWLAGRPGLEARWAELVEALGGRLVPELLETYLLDLKLWGMADYAVGKGGFVATYPAAVTSLPARRAVGLGQFLAGTNSDILLKICSALGLRNPPARKDGRIQVLMSVLTQGESCRMRVEGLAEDAHALFEWVRERGGWVPVQEMLQRAPPRRDQYHGYYGTMDSFFYYDPEGRPPDPLTALVRQALVVPVVPYPGSWYPSAYAVAEEVELAYSGRTLFETGPLQPPPLERAEQVAGSVPNPSALLRDVAHLLGFIGAGRCEWRQDGEPYKRSLVALGKALGAADADYPLVLWDLAASAGLVLRGRMSGAGFVPAEIGDTDPHQLFDRLLLAWTQHTATPTWAGAPPSWGEIARTRLLVLLQTIPPDTWLTKGSLEAVLRFCWPMVFTDDYRSDGSTAPDPGWAGLGHLLLAHGSTADGQAAIMLPAAHQQMLSGESAEDAAGLPPWDEGWIVQPDRSIVAPPNAHPNALIELWQVARLESNQGASVFRLKAETVVAALNRGAKPAEMRELLQKRSRVPLPPTVERLIGDQGARYGRVKVGTAQTYVQTDDPALLEELRHNRKLQQLEWREVAPGVAFVVSADPTSVLESLRRAGYLPVMEEGKRATLGEPGTWSNDRGRATGELTTLTRVVKRAIREQTSLEVVWTAGKKSYSAEIDPIDLHGHELHGLNLDTERDVIVPLAAVLSMARVDPFDDDAFDDDAFDHEDQRW